MPATSRPNRKLLSVTVLLAVLPAAIYVPALPPPPDAPDRYIDSALLTEVNSEGVRVIVD